MTALKKMGKIPEDIALIGFTIPTGRFVQLFIRFSQPAFEMGRVAAGCVAARSLREETSNGFWTEDWRLSYLLEGND
jgi:DNA-binding LacI/PurR family transcriptional regulator